MSIHSRFQHDYFCMVTLKDQCTAKHMQIDQTKWRKHFHPSHNTCSTWGERRTENWITPFSVFYFDHLHVFFWHTEHRKHNRNNRINRKYVLFVINILTMNVQQKFSIASGTWYCFWKGTPHRISISRLPQKLWHTQTNFTQSTDKVSKNKTDTA